MAFSIARISDKEWLRRNIEDGNIRLYPFQDLIDPVFISAGGYGAVYKAKAKTLARTVAYKLFHSQDENEMLENFVKEVGIHDDNFKFGYYVYLNYAIIL